MSILSGTHDYMFNKAYIKVLGLAAMAVALWVFDADAAQERLKIVVGSELDYPPFAVTTEDGQADGFSVDLMKAVCEIMDIDVTFRVGPWSEVRGALERGEVDALPLVSYSKERDIVFDFTAPHTVSHGVVFKRNDSPDIVSATDLRDKWILVMRADAGHDWLIRNDVSKNLVLTDTVGESLRLLSEGKQDFALAPRLVGLVASKKMGLTNIETTGPLFDAYGRGYGFAVQEGNYALLDQLNQSLSVIRSTGHYDAIYAKWFGTIDPKGLTAERILRYVAWGVGVCVLVGCFAFVWILLLRRTVQRQTTELKHANDDLENRVKDRTRDLQSEIVEHKKTEQARRVSELTSAKTLQRFQDAIESISEAFVLFDVHDRIVLCNENYRVLYPSVAELMIPGMSFEEILVATIDRRDAFIFVGDHDNLDDWKDWRTEQHRHPQHPHTIEMKDGRRFQLNERETKEGGIVGVYADITEVIAAQEQAEIANRTKTEFLANMSHELRTPIAIINSGAGMMVEEMFGPMENDKYRRYAENIKHAGVHLTEIINDLLDVSQIEMNRLKLNEKDINLKELARICRGLVEDRAQEKNLSVNVEVMDTLPLLRADELRLKQVLLNLLSNAIKFTPKNGDITLSACVDEDGDVVMSITDTGVGFVVGEGILLGTTLGREGNPYRREIQGAGIGLPLSKKLVELHGGALDIESTLGVGTVVSIRFPVDRSVY